LIINSKNMATYYTVDGELHEVKPENGKWFTYAELRDFVGGLVEIVPLPDGRSIIVNEEGKLNNLPENPGATAFWKEVYPIAKYPMNNDELIVGNALVVTEDELEQEE